MRDFFLGKTCIYLFLLLLLTWPTTGMAVPLTIGSLSDTPSEEVAKFLPFGKYLAAKLSKLGIDDARVLVRRSHAEMANLMRLGEVDLFIDSSLSALIVQRLSAGTFLARRWKKGVGQYHGVIFVRADSPIHTLADLVGHDIAFDEPFSSGGYLLPASELRTAGLSLVPASPNPSSDQRPLPKAVSYRFSGEDESTMLWVAYGRVNAGAMGNIKYTKLSAPMGDELRVIHRTTNIPYHTVVHRPGLPVPLHLAIHRLLLAMENDAVGKVVLKAFEKTSRFDDIPADMLRDLQNLKLELPIPATGH